MEFDLLVVDDEPGIRDLLTRLAAERGASCRTAASGEEGLALLQGGDRFRVLMADYRLGGMDGIEFLAAARALAPEATRVLFTGIDRARIAQEATLRAEISYFLVKPVGPRELRRVLGEALAPEEPARQPPPKAPQALRAYRSQSGLGALAAVRGRSGPGRDGGAD